MKEKMYRNHKLLEDVELHKRELLLVMTAQEAEQLQRELGEEYHCTVVHDSNQAVLILRDHYADFDAVFYQQELPGCSTDVFLCAVKEVLLVSMLPVIILIEDIEKISDHLLTEYADFCTIDFVQKPYNKAMLCCRLENAFRICSLNASLGEIEIDRLTGLYTKQAFLYYAGAMLLDNPEDDFTVVISDILNFKIYNSTYGRSKGDELLRVSARFVQEIVSDGMIARYGVDQFIVIVKTPQKDIAVYMEALQEQLKEAGYADIVLKFGVYDHVDRSLEIIGMCDRALQALQSIKKNYDLMYARYDGPVSQQEVRARMFEAHFARALENHQFVLWYQPKYNPYTERIVGAEALVRWKTEDGRLISPGEFLPIFEGDGLISQLDEYVFQTVCAKQSEWKHQGKQIFPVSVNLSRNSMHRPDIIKRYKAILERYEIEPKMVPIEITETAAIGNIQIKPLADAFNKAGFLLHMDDFGSGNSSIAGLHLLHFDTVKLDQSMTQLIGNEEGNLILMYIVSLGKELGFHLVAEGAETKEQIEYLKDIGCESIQGYYYSKALPVEEFEKLVDENFRKGEVSEQEFDYRYKLTKADSMVKRAMDRMIQRMPGGFFAYRSDDGRILSSNSFLWDMFGCSSEEEFMKYVGGTFQGMVCPEDYRDVDRYIKEQILGDEKEMDYVEYHIQRKDGKKIPIVDYGHLDHQPDGDIFYVFISPK